ncbi:F0F1 ATP synthase subunit delta [Rhodobacteraceae bacterium NNCM2]|nr:F0F1 ATP synthase subunit delta [Coraliihabitans acroporae]
MLAWRVEARRRRLGTSAGARRTLTKRFDVSASSTLTSSAAGRYATALFELAKEEGQLDSVEADLNSLSEALGESADLKHLISSPIHTRDEQGRALGAVAEKMGLGALTRNVLGLMAANRRLFALPQLIANFSALMADHRGEVTADVTAAKALTKAQTEKLEESIKTSIGRNVNLNVTVDEDIIGGLIVKVGSKMVDSSIRSKLTGLQNAMKEVG